MRSSWKRKQADGLQVGDEQAVQRLECKVADLHARCPVHLQRMYCSTYLRATGMARSAVYLQVRHDVEDSSHSLVIRLIKM